MGLTLYHGTAEHEEPLECTDLVSGYDGMIHFHPEYSPVKEMFPAVVQCDSNLSLESMPTLPDLLHWNPFEMDIQFEKLGIITTAERSAIEKGTGVNDYARRLNVESLRSYMEEKLQLESTKTLSLRELVNDYEEYDDVDEDEQAYDDYDIDEYNATVPQTLDAVDAIERTRERLFDILKSKGITAFKYKNRYEKELKDGYSVAVIDPSSVGDPVPVTRMRSRAPEIVLPHLLDATEHRKPYLPTPRLPGGRKPRLRK